MNKKLSIFAIVLIVVGLIGSIWSGFFSLPYFINKIQSYDEQINSEQVILDEKIDISNLDIDTDYASIYIEKSPTENIIIKRQGIDENRDLIINTKENKLSIKEEYKDTKTEKIKGIDDLVNKAMQSMFYNHNNVVKIYLPKDVDFNINTEGGNVSIKDDIFLNDFNYITNYGGLSLPENVKKIKNMNITSQNPVSFRLGELLGVENIDINSRGIDISSENYDLEDMLKYMPNKITINIDNLSDNSVTINSSVPISKELIINGYKSDVYINLPLDRYKFKFDMQAYNYIELNEFMSTIIDNDNNKDMEIDSSSDNIKNIKTIINKDEEIEYKIKSSSSNLYFQ